LKTADSSHLENWKFNCHEISYGDAHWNHISATVQPLATKSDTVKHNAFVNFMVPSHTLRLLLYIIKLQKSWKQNWLQFLLAAKSNDLKQQILKFYLQILSTET